MAFNRFLKELRATPEYDMLMEAKEQYAFKMTSREYCSMLWIHDMFEHKVKVKEMRKLVPQEYLWILQDILKQRLKPDRVFVDWNPVVMNLRFSILHNLAQAHKEAEYRKYQAELFPVRKVNERC